MPSGIVRGERCAKIRQESGVETGVMRDQHIGTEGADRGGQGGEDLGQAGLARDVLRGEVMHGGGGGRDVALGSGKIRYCNMLLQNRLPYSCVLAAHCKAHSR